MQKEDNIIEVSTRKVSCDGGGGALGHPLTYYVIGECNYVKCKYCDREFHYKENLS